MPPIKVNNVGAGEESDGDGDMSGGESERSVSSHEGGRESSEGDELDSDDSSEMDESECIRRRAECLEDMTELEHQFALLREQLYQERITQVETQLIEVKGGKSPEYLEPLQRLEENKRIRTEVAGILRQLRLANIRNKSEAEEQAAKQNFESEKQLAWDFIHEDLMDKIRRLEEDRHNVELSWGDGSEWGGRSRSRNSARRKAVTVSGPYIVYMLSEQDILEDWTTIQIKKVYVEDAVWKSYDERDFEKIWELYVREIMSDNFC